MRWCGPEVEVEGIVRLKTGGCPEDCHFCSQSGQFESPVRAVWLDIPSLVKAAQETAATGATEFCIVAAVRGPDERLMAQVREGVAAIRDAVDINVACSLGMLTQEQVDELAAMGVHRYNHNLETARSHFPQVVTTHSWEERRRHLPDGARGRHGAVLRRHPRPRRDDRAAGRVRRPARRARPRRGAAELPQPAARHPAWRPASSSTRATRCGPSPPSGSPCPARSCATPADARSPSATSTPEGLLGGINAVIVGNYLTTLGRPAAQDLATLEELRMPIKALSATI